MAETIYKKRSGTTNKGLDYEVLGVANYVIDLVTDEKIKDFRISSNHPDFGAFDDIVIETQQGNCAEVHAIQLKHNDRGTLYLKQLTSIKGDFSIKKYFDSVQKIKLVNAKFILYTNLKFNISNDTKFYLEGEAFFITVAKIKTSEAFKISEKTNYCYKFSVVKDENDVIPGKGSLYDKFFENFFLYTDQENSHELKLRVTEKFKSSFCASDVECNEYVRFVREWSSQEGTIQKLNKKWMRVAIALKVFYSHVRPLSFDSNANLEHTIITKRNILREAVDTFDVSIFGKESYDEVKDLWADAKNELTDLKMINQLRTKFHLNCRHVSDIAEADSLTLSMLLWLLGKAPLILTQDASITKALELCVGDKFILLCDESVTSFSENISVFTTLSDLKAKPTQYEQLIRNFTCSLQGKRDILLENLVKRGGDILTVLKTDDLLKMVRGQCRIGEAKESLSEPYVERCLLKNLIDFKILENLSKDTGVILDCVPPKSDLKKTLTNNNLININDFLNPQKHQNIENSVEKFSDSCTIYLSEHRYEYNEFSVICHKIKNLKNFHQFRLKDDGNLEWIRSRGDVSVIEKYKLSECCHIKESDLDCSEFQNTVNVLASDPGMGKSELMKSFKIKTFPELLTVILDPKDSYSFLKNNSDATNNSDAFFKFLLDEKYQLLSERDKAIFRIFLQQNKIIIAWDAVDELSDEHRDILSNIIVELSKNFLQWVTTRRHLLNTLQQKFNVLALNLNKFEGPEQKHYIQDRLAHLDETETIETILEKISSSFALVEHNDILGIPLQIFMLTELFRQNKKKYLQLLNNFFVLTDLYNYFIEEKTNILLREKLQIDLNTAFAASLVQSQKKQMHELCTEAALRLLFPDEILSKLAVQGAEDFKEIYEDHQDIGLITEIRDNIPRFIHNSFAEFLAARYFTNHLQNKDILMQVMFDQKYTNVRFFFDLFLARDSEAHIAILYKNFDFINSCDREILTHTDLGGRSVLHLACSWGQRYPELIVKRSGGSCVIDDEGNFNTHRESNEYLETIDYLLAKCDVSKPDEIYNMSPKEYARKYTCLPAEMRIVMIMKQNTQKLVETDHMINILYYSAYYCYHDEFAFYFELFEQYLSTEEKTLRHTVDNVGNCIGRTLLYIAAEMGHLKIVEILVRAGADINLPDKDGFTPLYVASWNGHEAIVEVLLKADAGTNLTNKNGTSPLHVASLQGQQTIVQVLLKMGADINLPEKNGWTPLYIASWKGHEKIVEILLQAGADVNLPNKDYWTPLYIASLQGHQTIVEILLEAGADVNLPNKDGWTPLHIASLQGHQTIVDILLEAGADVNLPDKDGWTPLYIACHQGHETIVDILLKEDVDINLSDKDSCTPLYIASWEGHRSIVEKLFKAGADINLSNKNGCSPLYIASSEGYENTVEILLTADADADADLSNKDGSTPLYIASHQGHKTIVETLLKAGADANFTKKDGSTPLYIASRKGHAAIIEILLKVVTDTNLPNKDDATPLYIASWKGHETIVKILLEAGADNNLPDKDGCTPLYIASWKGHETIVKILLEAGADNYLPDKDGCTPLYIASQNKHETIVEILLKAGADSNLAKKNGWAPLHVASAQGHESIVEILLKADVNINLSCEDGRTPLHIASHRGCETIVEILLKAGADINAPDKDGATPLHIASHKEYEGIVEILLQAGADSKLSNKDGFTPLHVASAQGHESIVEILLKGDININLPCESGRTSLHIASHRGYETIVELLLKAGAHMNVPDKEGATPLHIASQNKHESIVEVLLKAGADGNFSNISGDTPLYIASQLEHERIVEILLKADVDINLAEEDGWTPLYIASQNKHETIVKKLVKAGADSNLSNKNDATPLYIASYLGHETIVQILLEAGADSNLSNKNGSTPLFIASQYGYKSVVEILLKAGTDINHLNKDGLTSLHVASANGHQDVVYLLLNTNTYAEFTAKQLASKNGHRNIVNLFLQLERCLY